MSKSRSVGIILVMLSALLWGSIGFFIQKMNGFGFDSLQIAFLRLASAAVFNMILLFCMQPHDFGIKVRDIPLFLGLGIGSVALMVCCYFLAIQMCALSTASILMYLSPIWVMLMSALFFHEKITGRKIIALVFALAGCILVAGVAQQTSSPLGIMLGILAGISYALYSILSRIALKRYTPFAVTAYAFLIATVATIFVVDIYDIIQKIVYIENAGTFILWTACLGIFTAVLPFLLYTIALHWIEASHAAILATLEPVVNALVGVFLFHERLTLLSIIGMGCIISTVVILNTNTKHE